MAAKKTVKEEVVEEVKEAKAPASKAEETVTIKLPIERGKHEEAVFVSVNERTWLIKKGVEVEVPKCVAEVLALQEKALEEAYEFEQANIKG